MVEADFNSSFRESVENSKREEQTMHGEEDTSLFDGYVINEPSTNKRKYKRKLKLKKENIVLTFEADQLLELKRQLFKAGLTYHQFFGYLLQQQVAHDPRMLEFLAEAQNYKKQRILEGKEEKVDAETLYSLIEEKLTEPGR